MGERALTGPRQHQNQPDGDGRGLDLGSTEARQAHSEAVCFLICVFICFLFPFQWLLDAGEDSCRICKVLHRYC